MGILIKKIVGNVKNLNRNPTLPVRGQQSGRTGKRCSQSIDNQKLFLCVHFAVNMFTKPGESISNHEYSGFPTLPIKIIAPVEFSLIT